MLEYVGPDLTKCMDKEGMSKLSKAEQGRIWIDASQALQHLKDRRILHHDIKPGNILLSERRAVICDFGLATEVGKSPKPCNGGTPCYIPPEYLFDDRRGFEGEIWALGVTMLFVLGLIALPRREWIIAEIPRSDSVYEQMRDWLCKGQDVRRTVPEDLSLVCDMLEIHPKRRITAADLVERLRATQTDQPFGCALLST